MVEEALLEALRENPHDENALLVYADALQTRGDTRGELLMLQHRHETSKAGLTEHDGLERMLVLAAEHGFLRVPDDPDVDVLRFRGGPLGTVYPWPAEYRVVHAGKRYRIRHDHGIEIFVDEVRRASFFVDWIDLDSVNLIIAPISRAILAGQDLRSIAIPDENFDDARLGRCPTTPLPPKLRAMYPAVDWEIEARDRARWFHLWDALERWRE